MKDHEGEIKKIVSTWICPICGYEKALRVSRTVTCSSCGCVSNFSGTVLDIRNPTD